MTFFEALNVLNIDSKYDEKKLKSAYHKLAKKYHPDQLKYDDKENKDILEKIKTINLAYETLLEKRDNYNFDDKKSYESKVKVFEYKISKTKILEKYKINRNEHIFIDYANYINETIMLFISKEYNTVDEVEHNYQDTINKIISIYKEIEQSFYTKYKIDKREIIETINYDCSFNEYYERLLTIKEKYSFNNKIAKIIEQSTEKYKYYVGYNIARPEIILIKDNTYKIIMKLSDTFKESQIDFLLIQNYINKMNTDIEKTFSKTFILQKKINDLKIKVEGTKDTNIINNYIILQKKFTLGQLFFKTKYELNLIEQLIIIKENIRPLKRKIEKNYLKDYMLAKSKEKKRLVNIIYMNILDYIQNVKKLQMIPESISFLQEKDYLGVIDLIENQVIDDMLKEYNYSKNKSDFPNNKKKKKYKYKHF